MPLYWIESGETVLSIVKKWLNIDNYIWFELKVLELSYLIHLIPQNIAIQTKKGIHCLNSVFQIIFLAHKIGESETNNISNLCCSQVYEIKRLGFLANLNIHYVDY